MTKRRDLNDEKVLIKGCIAGKVDAQRELFRIYSPKLLGICARYCANLEDARDALHDGFVKILTQIEKFNHKSKLETWMTRIMINTAIDKFKAEIRFNLYDDHDKVISMGDEEIESDGWLLEDHSPSMQELLDCIRDLPDGYRMVFNLYAIEGYSHNEISQKLNISTGTSKSQLARARRMLMDMITKKGLIEGR